MGNMGGAKSTFAPPMKHQRIRNAARQNGKKKKKKKKEKRKEKKEHVATTTRVLMPLDPHVMDAKYWLQDKMLAGARVTFATSMKHQIRNAARQNGKKKKKKKAKERKKEKKKEHLTAAHVLMPLDPHVMDAKYWLQDKMLAGARVTFATSMKHQ